MYSELEKQCCFSFHSPFPFYPLQLKRLARHQQDFTLSFLLLKWGWSSGPHSSGAKRCWQSLCNYDTHGTCSSLPLALQRLKWSIGLRRLSSIKQNHKEVSDRWLREACFCGVDMCLPLLGYAYAHTFYFFSSIPTTFNPLSMNNTFLHFLLTTHIMLTTDRSNLFQPDYRDLTMLQ